MFGANRKKFMEGGVESEYGDDSSLYYSQQSMFPPHRSEKDVSPFCPFCPFCPHVQPQTFTNASQKVQNSQNRVGQAGRNRKALWLQVLGDGGTGGLK